MTDAPPSGRTVSQQYSWALRFWSLKFAGKWLWMVIAPMLLGVVVGGGLYLIPNANIAHDRGLLDISSGLLSMLVGFFVAALGVVLALPHGRLDTPFGEDANPPRDGKKALSWRDFALVITSYLVLISLITYLIAVAALVVHPGIEWKHYEPEVRSWVRIIGGGAYAGLFAHVLSITLFSIFWIAAKLPEVQAPPRPKARKPLSGPAIQSSGATQQPGDPPALADLDS